ncbi:MAG: glutamate ligase domain-containing protein, partial [Pseudomonadota bacterium]
YNANPSSLRAGIDVLRDLPGDRWLVLGEMAELGAHTRDAHVEAGRYAREAGLGRLYAIGAPTREAVTAFGPGAEWFESADALAARVRGELRADVTVLIKGSRLNRLERVVEARAATGAGAGAAPGPDGGSQAA